MIPAFDTDIFAETFDEVEGQDDYKFKDHPDHRNDPFVYEKIENDNLSEMKGD